MIIQNNCNLSRRRRDILIKGFDILQNKKFSKYLNPKELDNIVLTGKSTVSTEIFSLNPEMNISIFNRGKLTHTVIPIGNIPKIIKNEELFSKLSRYKRKKLSWIFCKAVCSSRIKVISRLNETRKNTLVSDALKEMRILENKLSKAKSREEMMGYEGNIAKLFYFCLGEFNNLFDVRRDRFSIDIVNSLMNLGHTVLRNKINTRLILNGINPVHGFLHQREGRNENYLTWDFAEFWIPYVDKLIFYSLEKGIIKERDFNKEGRLNNLKIKSFINLIYKRITDKEIDSKIKEFIGFLEGKNHFSWKTK